MKISSFLTTCFLAVLATSAHAQITGPNPTYAGSTQVYSWTGAPVSNPVWQFGNGTKVSQTGNSVTVTWNTNVTGGAVILLNGSTYKGTLNVTLMPALAVPIAPALSPATSITPTSFMANWASSATAASYRLDVSTSLSFGSFVTGYNNLSVPGTSQVVSGLTGGGTFYYRVRAVNSAGNSLNSETSPPVVCVLGYPTNIAVTALSSSLELSWPSVQGATAYLLDVASDAAFTNILPGYNAVTVNATNKVVSGLSPSTPYWIRMKSFYGSTYSVYSPTLQKTTLAPPRIIGPNPTHAGGTQEYVWTGGSSNLNWIIGNGTKISQAGNSVTVTWNTTGTGGAVILPTYDSRLDVDFTPAIPAILPASSITASSFTANWGTSALAASYRLDVSTSPSFSSFVNGYNNLSVSGTSKIVSGLIGGGTFYYRLRAVNSYGDSPNSETSGPVEVILGYPTNITVTAHNQSLDLSWAEVLGATTYLLDVATDAAFNNIVPGYNAVAVNGTNKVVDGLRPSTKYWIRIKSSDGTTYSSYCVALQETTLEQFATVNENYIVADVLLVSGVTSPGPISTLPREHVFQSVQYFDGLGRPMQAVTTEGSPLKKDIVQPTVYDAFGREATEYLSYVSPESNGWYKKDFVDKDHADYTSSAQYQFYNNPLSNIAVDIAPFSENIFEPSPLNRVLKQGSAGDAWQPNENPNLDRSVKKTYEFNQTDEVLLFAYDELTEEIDLELLNHYEPNQLYKNKTIDEHNNEVIEFTDKEGKPVLRKVQYKEDNGLKLYAETYYIYDDLGNIVTVLPPEATRIVRDPSEGAGYNVAEHVLDHLSFQYRYDGRNRMSKKKVPGADWVYSVYDNHNRLVLTQDGNQRTKETPEWTFTKFDILNRPVLTGIYKDALGKDQSAMQAEVNDYYTDLTNKAWYETYIGQGGTVHGYDNLSFPQVTSAIDYMTVTYYNDYDFVESIAGNPGLLSFDNQQLLASGADKEQDQTPFHSVKDMVTGTKIKNLETNDWYWSVFYYDNDQRLIQKVAENHKGGADKTTNVFDFVGKVLRTKTEHTANGKDAQTVTQKFEYDHVGRLLKTWHTINEDNPVLLSKKEYNELGELTTKKLHSEDLGETFQQHEDYRYNIRGWLTRINNADLSLIDNGPKDYFGMEFGYDNDLGLGNFTPQYNGNISAITWSANLGIALPTQIEPTERAYKLTYDPLNRLREAEHSKKIGNWKSTLAFSEAVDYDANGNIKSLARSNEKGTLLDWLIYDFGDASNYGNQLKSVTDYGITTRGFKDGNSSDDDYGYDANGNMIQDKNKGLIAVKYNSYLNFTEEIHKDSGEKIKYTYNADGVKLAEKVYAQGSSTPSQQTEYLGPFVYQNDTLKFIQYEEGKIIIPKPDTSDPSPEYQYQIKDHLGNTRLTFTTKQKTDVYKATMEDTGLADITNPRVQEMAYFDNLFETEITNVNQWINHTSEASGNAIYLNGSEPRIIGPSITLRVYPGDTVRMEAFGKFENKASHSVMTPAALLATLLSPVSATMGLDGVLVANTDFGSALGALLTAKGYDQTKPGADLNYILFDKNWNVISYDFDRIDVSAGFDAAREYEVDFDKLQLDKTILQEGYLFVYLSNESPGSRVWFDDLTISYAHSPIIQFEDYYPFGLSMSETAFERGNDNYRGMATSDGTGLQDLGFRYYDPILGRFHAQDPLGELQLESSTYQYAGNNPINQIDVLGLKLWERKRPRATRGYSLFKKKNHQKHRSNNAGRQKQQRETKKPPSEKKEKNTQKRDERTAAKGDGGETKQPLVSTNDFELVKAFADAKSVNGPLYSGKEVDAAMAGFANKANSESGYLHQIINGHNQRSDNTNTSFTLPLSIIQAYEMASKNAGEESTRRDLYSHYPVSEARALDQLSLVTQSNNINWRATALKQAALVLANTSNSDDKFNLPHFITVTLTNGGITISLDGNNGTLLEFSVQANVSENGSCKVTDVTVRRVSDSSTEELKEIFDLGARKAEEMLKAEQVRLGGTFTSTTGIIEYLTRPGVQQAIKDYMEGFVVEAQSGDVQDFLGMTDSKKKLSATEKQELQSSIDKFKNEQNLSAEVKLLDKDYFDRLKEQYSDGRRIPEKDVTLLLTKDRNGKIEKHFVYRDGLFVMPTEKEITNSDGSKETIQLSGTLTQVEEYRDEFIDKAIEDNTLEGVHVQEDFGTLNIFEKGMWVIKVTKTLLDDIEIKEDHWNSEKVNTWPFDVNETLAGGGNIAIDELKSIPDMVAMGLSVFDKEVRSQIVTAVSELNWVEIKDGLAEMFNDKMDKYSSTNPEVVTYQASADGTTIIITVLTGGTKLISKIKDIFSSIKKLSKIDWGTIDLPKAKTKKLGGDISGNKALEDAITADPNLAKAWDKLDDIGADEALRKNPDFLKNVNDWDAGGVKLSKNGDNINLSNAAGEKIGEIKNGNLLPEKYGDAGTSIGEPKNGYQVVDDAGEIKVKRKPNLSGYDEAELAQLKPPGGHALERHGADVTDDALKKRATTGKAPDGSRSTDISETTAYIPPKSTKFSDVASIKKSLKEVGPGSAKYNAAKTTAESSNKLRFAVEHDFGSINPIGSGYTIPGKSKMDHPIVNLPLTDVPVSTGPLSKVKAIYLRDSPSSEWYLETMYPD